MDASKVESYKRTIEAAIPSVINRTALGIGSKYTGKVRDVYFTSKHLLLLTTDRLSAFDRLLACIPFKGRVFSRRVLAVKLVHECAGIHRAGLS